jgi:hypothetical protein
MFKVQDLYEQFSHLPKRQRIIIYCAVSFIFLFLADRLIINPVVSKIDTLNKELLAREEGIKRDLRILSMKDKITSESSKYSSFFHSAKSEEEENVILLKELENLAGKSSVYLIDIKPGGTKEAGLAKKFLIILNCEAQMEQLVEFMYNIENSVQLFIIDKYQVTQKSSESSVIHCTMTVSKMAMP